jgi:hypothetical protein
MKPVTIPKAKDGYYHPKNEQEISDLVNKAREEGLEIRSRGSAHSVSQAIYTGYIPDEMNKVNQEHPPETDNINLILDQYRGVELYDKDQRIVAVDAGTNLGVDPFDPTKTSTLENSLLQQLDKKWGWTVSNLGGIDFQTVGGFMSTGSSGGSLRHSIHDDLWGLRIIGSDGEPYEIRLDSDDDPNHDKFHAAGVAMGLFGIISKLYFKCVPVYNIQGQEASTRWDDASMQMFEYDPDDKLKRPSLENFLKEVEYTRLMWWPQRGIDQVVTWQAQRIEPVPGFRPSPYQEFSNYPNVGEPVCSIFYITMGNYQDLSQVKHHLDRSFNALRQGLIGYLSDTFLKSVAKPIAIAVTGLLRLLLHLVTSMSKSWLNNHRPAAFSWFINTFQGLDSDKSGMSQYTPQNFQDIGWKGLPMDNSASDDLMPTEFTEIWIPIGRAEKVMCLLRDYFATAKTIEEAYELTGYYAIELYGSKPSPFWMSMSYTDGKDEWKDGVIRLDIFWFEFNPGNPSKIFFPPFWKLLRDNDIPNRLHWGKFHPILTDGDPDNWVEFYRSQYPHWDEFLAMRAEKDPSGVFLNDYWRRHLGLEAKS